MRQGLTIQHAERLARIARNELGWKHLLWIALWG